MLRARNTTTMIPDLLRMADLDAAALSWLLDTASSMKAHPSGFRDVRQGETVVCLFEKPSTRTRVSFAAAAARLGMAPLVVRPDELQLGRGETIGDTGRVLSRYAAALVVRTFAQETLETLAAASDVPVVNALSDTHHPCQALADLLTLQEWFGRLRGLRLVFAGDGASNVCHSLIEASALAGIAITIACPDEHRPDPDVLTGAWAIGGDVRVTPDIDDAVRDADALYTDVWVSMGQDVDADRRRAALRPYQVTAARMQRAAPDAVFLHCLPAHRGDEVAAEVLDGPQSLVVDQAENRLWTAMAVLHELTSRETR